MAKRIYSSRDKKGRFIKGIKPIAGFKKGCIPWNKGKKGATNSGSFKKGHIPSTKGKGKGWVRTSGYKFHSRGKQRQEHRLIWENHNGVIDKGFVIHHINGNKLDNQIENLKLMTNGEHTSMHRRENG